MVVLKKSEPELSYILAVSLVVPVFKNVEERSTAKNYHTLSLFSVVSKVFKNLQIIGLLIT